MHSPSYAIGNQRCLALTNFNQCFLSAESTSAIIMLQGIGRVLYLITKDLQKVFSAKIQ